VKGFLMVVGSLALVGYGLWALIHGQWILGLVTWFIAEPIWLFVADILTGLILAPIVGIAQLLGRRS